MKISLRIILGCTVTLLSFVEAQAYLSPLNPDAVTAGVIPATVDNPAYLIGPGSVPDYLTMPNWAYSPPLRKFVDKLPGLGSANQNNLGQYIPVAIPDITTYPGSDYYEIELRQFTEQMHSDMPATTLRGYIQVNHGTVTAACTDPSLNQPNPCTSANNTAPLEPKPHYLGPIIVSKKDRPVRVKFINKLPTGAGGDLFIPVDTTIMGAGPFEIDYDPVTKAPIPKTSGTFTQNRAELHLHGGRTPWISDGTPHQWITPAGESTPYPTGVSVQNVPDMPDPGPGAQTYYWTNQQSSRMLFYHDHAWGITRLNVYVGEAAGYLIRDDTEQALIDSNIIPGTKSNGSTSLGGEIPLVIQDKTFVDAATVRTTDPTWNWGTGTMNSGIRDPKTGDFWWPHVYMPAQNPFDPTGISPMGRWAYGPYFWPATNNPFQPVPNPYFSPLCDANDASTPGSNGGFCQPPEIPSTPNPSWGAEAFMDTPIVNGTAYPVLTIDPKPYRLRILNAAHDRFLNLQLYKADPTPPAPAVSRSTPLNCTDFPSSGYGGFANACASMTEVKMLPALDNTAAGAPATWPADGRAGGVPDWNTRGPNWIMIGTEGGFLPQPVVIPSQPITWNTDVTTFNAGNVNGGSLMLGPAERADVIVDFSAYAGQTLILYNDAPAPWPALDPHYDYYTGAPDNRAMGGADTTPIGFGPNTRTIMQIKVGNSGATAFNMTNLTEAFKPSGGGPGVFRNSQEPIIVAQGDMNMSSDPALFSAFLFPSNFSAYNATYNASFPNTWPLWGISQINDKQISFRTLNSDGTLNPDVQTLTMKTKAIQDEQGETFDDFGRMRAGLGLELANAGAAQVNFIIQTYSDPATEVLNEGETQVWKITHNGVDTHPIHFHLFDVQVLNRVGWDGFLRLPDPTELGWKDTVRISPLEDTIVAVRPVKPKLPFGVPTSYRPLNPATIIGDATELSTVNPTTGQAWTQPNLNRLMDFAWEYVWHCHILSHEENDMMRPVQYNVASAVPDSVAALAATPVAGSISLTWNDPTPPVPGNLGNAKNEIGFRIERCSGLNCIDYTAIGTALANATSYTDAAFSGAPPYSYRVFTYNAAGDSAPSSKVTASPSGSVDGDCGTSHGSTLAAKPSSGLCTAGSATTVTGTGPWGWNCLGFNGGGNTTCSANIQTYSVTFASAGNGTVAGTTTQTVNHGSSATEVVATPATGYHFVSWTDPANNVVGSAPALLVTNVTAPGNYTAHFAIDTFTVTFAAGANGAIANGATNQIVSYGGSTTLVTAAAVTAGYHFTNWTNGIGTVMGSSAGLVVTNVTTSLALTANFAVDTFTVTTSAGAGGAITPTTTLAYGSSHTVTATPAQNYHITTITVDGMPVPVLDPKAFSYSFTGVMSPHTVAVNFAIDTVSVGLGYGVSGPAPAPYGALPTYTITPPAGYSVTNVYVNSVPIGPVASYTYTTPITTPQTIYASFALQTYTIALDRCISGPTTVSAGELPPSYTFNAPGFDVAAAINGVSVGSLPGLTYTFPASITSDQTITATYSINPAGSTAPVRLVTGGTTTEFSTVQAAYDAAVSGSIIRLKAGTATGTLVANRAISVVIKGGFNATYTANCGTTRVGKVQVQKGTVRFERVLR